MEINPYFIFSQQNVELCLFFAFLLMRYLQTLHGKAKKAQTFTLKVGLKNYALGRAWML